MSLGRRIVITLVVVVAVLAAVVYVTVPLSAWNTAELQCQMTIPANGSYTVEWKPLPPAHWECVATPEGEPTRIIDLGWWPTAPESAVR